MTRPSADAVRERRLRIAERLDETAERCPRGADVYSIACGHLREAEVASSVADGRIRRFVALDADARSLDVVSRRHPDVTVREGSFATLLRDRSVIGSFDFVYSAGLFDYMADRIASKLVRTMFGMLRPGGRLLVSNFLPCVVDAGYLETYFGWHLIYRDRGQLAELGAELPAESVAGRRVYEDSHRAIGYLEIVRSRVRSASADAVQAYRRGMHDDEQPQDWPTVSRREGADLILFRARHDLMCNPRTGAALERLVLETPAWCNIVARTDDDRIVVVRQYRFGIAATTTEIPGGMVDPGEAPLDAAVRELSEETGYRAARWETLGSVQPNPAFQDNLLHMFLAESAERVCEPRPDPGEDLRVDTLSEDECVAAIRAGEIRHSLVLCALARVLDLRGGVWSD